jgi:O-antigen/teichoic acid export membrane protein
MTAASNSKWAAVGQSARILSQLANIFILARILPPSDYGLMAMAGVATNLALLLRDMGTAAAVVQKRELDHHIINAVFWLNVAMGLTIAIILVASSPLLADIFKSPALVGVLCSLAIAFPLSSSSAVHQALLERQSHFKRLAFIDITCAILSMAGAVAAAMCGLGVYSLVIQSLLTAGLTTLFLWLNSPWRPSKDVQMSRLKELFGFSSNMAGFQLVNYLFRNADSMVVGRMLGQSALGIYSIAYKIMLMPVQNITWVSSRAIFPVMCRQQNDIPAMAELYLSTARTISFLAAPIMAGIFAARHDFVELALGSKWGMVATLLGVMAPIGYLQSINASAGAVFMAQGKTSVMLKLGIYSAIIHIIAFIIGSHWGIEGVAWSYLIASVSVIIPTLYVVQKALSLHFYDTAKAILPSAVTAMFAAIVVLMIQQSVMQTKYLTVNLLIQFLVGATVYLSILYFFLKPYFVNVLKRN